MGFWSELSKAAGVIVGTAGAVVGGLYGGPAGASAGWAIGSSVGNVAKEADAAHTQKKDLKRAENKRQAGVRESVDRQNAQAQSAFRRRNPVNDSQNASSIFSSGSSSPYTATVG